MAEYHHHQPYEQHYHPQQQQFMGGGLALHSAASPDSPYRNSSHYDHGDGDYRGGSQHYQGGGVGGEGSGRHHSGGGSIGKNNGPNHQQQQERQQHKQESMREALTVLFSPCESDPRGSIHKLWALSCCVKVILFVTSIIVAFNLHATEGSSRAIISATVWTSLLQVAMGSIGTYVIHRHPTSFSIGFLLGLLLVVSNQYLILFSTFADVTNDGRPHRLFAFLTALLAVIYFVTAMVLAHFREHVLISPIDLQRHSSNFHTLSGSGRVISGPSATVSSPTVPTAVGIGEESVAGVLSIESAVR